MSEKNKEKLFAEFPPVSTPDWEKVIERDLKGADYNRKLVWRTIEGFEVRPYYRKENLKNIPHLGEFPGEFPFIRGNKSNNNEWYIRQNIEVENVEEANKKALDVLMKGVTSLGFTIKDKDKFGENEIKTLLQDIFLDSIELNFQCGCGAEKLLDVFINEIKRQDCKAENINASIDFDPIGNFTLKGNFCSSEKEVFDIAKKLIQKTQGFPNFRTITIHADYFKNAGASIVHELAFALAAGTEYLTKLSDRNLSADEIAEKIKFNLAVASSYFQEIAKLRAARLLWAKIVESFGLKDKNKARMNIHCLTAQINKTVYDPYVNMLRTTTEGMSATIGGCDSLTIEPFNQVFEKTTDFSERIARNQQNLLNEESYFGKIADPGAGSYYIENLTHSIIEHSWKLFLEIQEKGGYIEAFKQGFIQEKINTVIKKRKERVATRRDNLLGTNQFPNFNELIETEMQTSVLEPTDNKAEDAVAEPIKLQRLAQEFERLRYSADKYTKKHKRPIAFMFTYGNLAMRRARSQFSCNFFACGGFGTIDNNGFANIDEGVNEVKKVKPEIVVVCSSDDEYADIVPEIFEKLKDETTIVVAGAPKCMDELKEKGIHNYIHVRSNVLETLKNYHKALGIQ